MVLRNWRTLKVVLHLIYSEEVERKENNTTSDRDFLSCMMWYFVYNIYVTLYYWVLLRI